MKRLAVICAFIAIALCANAMSLMDKERVIRFEELPVGAQKMIKTHFPQMKIALITEESDFLEKSFTVMAAEGIKVEFNKKGEWKEIECPNSEVPTGIIPQKISAFVKENFPGAKILSIEIDDSGEYDVKLNNRVSVEFNKRLEPVEIDI